jgi:hypothetical protein
MKPYLFFGVVAVGLLASQIAHAQGANAKSSDNLLKDARHITDEAEPMQRTAQIEPEVPVTRIAPAAGRNTSSYDDFTGIYVGGEIGYSVTDDVEGRNGGLFLGYGLEHDFDMLGAYVGLELGYEWSGADGNAVGLSYDKDHAWTATLRPGVKISKDSLGYGIIGYTRAEFEGAGDKDNLDGLIFGVGGQFDTNTVFKPRLEYTHTNYEDGNLAGNSFDATENAIKLGAVFQF